MTLPDGVHQPNYLRRSFPLAFFPLNLPFPPNKKLAASFADPPLLLFLPNFSVLTAHSLYICDAQMKWVFRLLPNFLASTLLVISLPNAKIPRCFTCNFLLDKLSDYAPSSPTHFNLPPPHPSWNPAWDTLPFIPTLFPMSLRTEFPSCPRFLLHHLSPRTFLSFPVHHWHPHLIFLTSPAGAVHLGFLGGWKVFVAILPSSPSFSSRMLSKFFQALGSSPYFFEYPGLVSVC